MTALLVDDSPAMRLFLRRVLDVSGLNIQCVLEAGNGREALECLHARWVDLVLCDVNMPEMNGEQFLAALSNSDSRTAHPCVIVISTDSTTSRVERVLRLGASGFLRKPFTPEQVRTIVNNVMEAGNVPRD
ncbi:MAG TPA: response regulator [Bryobacteraceae bacterium]|nr:response regulator [Bryobacteraceae bacterium]